ncbi:MULTISPECIES: hypothetical protein [Bacillus cereus group]|uniref:hypothetical protein n=1 Tax=Bacillus cereus group TaxID=86661 RepID=UPI000BEC13EE|nr:MULTISPECIES: hypothetical protein [Bacillus cereus group]MEB8798694.1 hypothetical protein [Bacillus cereus]MEB8811239.1 hypothetical protein [Bacillus cereus]MEB8992223.1 hypothetical protein [Bacillus cereus]MEB9183065.1 hypothetical protein [Bacillus cereus]MEC3021869.1 hypothetical protein [Bacillus cereus]
MKDDPKLRFSKCIYCENEDFSLDAHFCKRCGTSLYNSCNDSEDTCLNINPPDAFYCESCGGETFLLKVSAEMCQTDTTDYAEEYIRGK